MYVIHEMKWFAASWTTIGGSVFGTRSVASFTSATELTQLLLQWILGIFSPKIKPLLEEDYLMRRSRIR
jgi:hypothetical protein